MKIKLLSTAAKMISQKKKNLFLKLSKEKSGMSATAGVVRENLL